MISPGDIDVAPGAGRGVYCPFLDYARGPEGKNHLKCRLTNHFFGPGQLEDAVCLRLCAYPKQYARGRCQHADVTNVLLTEGDPPLPRIHCKAHHNYDAPGYCDRCRDYLPPEAPVAVADDA